MAKTRAAGSGSCIYQGIVAHHRLRPKRHRFVYRTFSLLLDLDELPQLDRQLNWLSINRFNLLSFHEKDHGRGQGRGQGTLREHITQLLQHSGYPEACGTIKLLCYPRILGYVFNPLSVYFCYDSNDQLTVIIYEVSNTFKERHSYLLPVTSDADSAPQPVRHYCHKHMYVSPFTPMQSRYGFRIQPPGQRVNIGIRQSEADDQRPLLYAVMNGDKRPLSDGQLLNMLVRHPLMTLKVITSIHWQALRLWLKGTPFHRHCPTHAYSLSWQDKTGVSHYEVL